MPYQQANKDASSAVTSGDHGFHEYIDPKVVDLSFRRWKH